MCSTPICCVKLHIAAALREEIVSGSLAPGAKLRTEQILAAEWSVAPQTIRHVIAILKNEGLVIGKAESGGECQRPRNSSPRVRRPR